MSRLDRRSDSQANAEALVRRDHSFTEASRVSVNVAWNVHNRVPTTLTEAVSMVRQAYADEVPTKLHEGYDSIGEGGTPKMAPRFEAYLDDDPRSGLSRKDPETGQRDAIDYFKTPFRAALASYETNRAALVRAVAIGGFGPVQAASMVGVPPWCARLVAEDTLFGFLRNLTDVKVALAKREPEAA